MKVQARMLRASLWRLSEELVEFLAIVIAQVRVEVREASERERQFFTGDRSGAEPARRSDHDGECDCEGTVSP